ncbi:hypothetical protein CHS0354_030058 [Potamilus streckersoni]|uniref:Uncharacterized protein n=1 Tax=Potamilus streckersoni TaxID=2493646 RepID=A0AAE0RKY5_9BIVA|nr:hypothetical protein CHS0354_030058 [Potamilus streckersoni]
MPNIITGKDAVPEFLAYNTKTAAELPGQMASAAIKYLTVPAEMEKLRTEIAGNPLQAMNLRSYIFYRLLKFFLVTAGVLNMLSLIKIVTETFSFLNIADIWSVLVLVLYPIPYINLNVIPIAMLIAAYMTVRQLSLNSEITAMKASGIPFTYILKPMCSLMAIVAAVQAVNVSYISPYFLHRFEEEKIKLGKDLFLSSLVPGSPNQFGDSMIYFSKMGQQLSLEDVLVVNQVHEEFKIIQADTLSVKASRRITKPYFSLTTANLSAVSLNRHNLRS